MPARFAQIRAARQLAEQTASAVGFGCVCWWSGHVHHGHS